ncbi:small VCP/p97-interacting protein [Parasteatoda tepidariorum]|uniref:small VCP/p97-interacting protein n=1 Tax=Parasteatoda tepidariorum TaxID=114398 RepID=UPI001C719682|nr:small VCP/p97-interacting protein [Parasteatoda tepidariorum]
MGSCLDCCKGSDPPYTSPNDEERRQRMVEAAERRQHEQETRGLKDDLAAKRVEKNKERARQIDEALDKSNSDAHLRWQVS